MNVLRQRGVAERMIESFMLIANETVAEHFMKFIDYASSLALVPGTASFMSQETLQDIMKGRREPMLMSCL